jgi:hypothetical protein
MNSKPNHRKSFSFQTVWSVILKQRTLPASDLAPLALSMTTKRSRGVRCRGVVGPIQMLTPLIENNTLTAQNASKVPRVTGKNPATNAHHSSRENRECLRPSTKIMPLAKQIGGVTITISIQDNGVADQSFLKALVA